MMFDEFDVRKQIHAPQNQIERARKNSQFAKERTRTFISDLRKMNGDEVLATSLEHLLKIAERFPVEEGQRMRLEERLELLFRQENEKQTRKIRRHATTFV